MFQLLDPIYDILKRKKETKGHAQSSLWRTILATDWWPSKQSNEFYWPSELASWDNCKPLIRNSVTHNLNSRNLWSCWQIATCKVGMCLLLKSKQAGQIESNGTSWNSVFHEKLGPFPHLSNLFLTCVSTKRQWHCRSCHFAVHPQLIIGLTGAAQS